jgi:hypothetical protein
MEIKVRRFWQTKSLFKIARSLLFSNFFHRGLRFSIGGINIAEEQRVRNPLTTHRYANAGRVPSRWLLDFNC